MIDILWILCYYYEHMNVAAFALRIFSYRYARMWCERKGNIYSIGQKESASRTGYMDNTFMRLHGPVSNHQVPILLPTRYLNTVYSIGVNLLLPVPLISVMKRDVLQVRLARTHP